MTADGKCYLCRRGSCLPGETCPKCGTVQPSAIDDRKPMFPAMQSTEQLKKQVWNDAIEAAAKAVMDASIFPKNDNSVLATAERIIILGVCERKIKQLKIP